MAVGEGIERRWWEENIGGKRRRGNRESKVKKKKKKKKKGKKEKEIEGWTDRCNLEEREKWREKDRREEWRSLGNLRISDKRKGGKCWEIDWGIQLASKLADLTQPDFWHETQVRHDPSVSGRSRPTVCSRLSLPPAVGFCLPGFEISSLYHCFALSCSKFLPKLQNSFLSCHFSLVLCLYNLVLLPSK